MSEYTAHYPIGIPSIQRFGHSPGIQYQTEHSKPVVDDLNRLSTGEDFSLNNLNNTCVYWSLGRPCFVHVLWSVFLPLILLTKSFHTSVLWRPVREKNVWPLEVYNKLINSNPVTQQIWTLKFDELFGGAYELITRDRPTKVSFVILRMWSLCRT